VRLKENYTPFVSVALFLTLGILSTFQIYLWREPIRIQRDEARDEQSAIEAGAVLYAENCVACHGVQGEGGVGPALNSKEFLELSPDELVFSLTRTGVPGTRMPAWGQAFGGPFTDEQVLQITAFIRAWEPDAPEIVEEPSAPDPVRGAAIFSQTCFVCHGVNGEGTERAPALNDPERLGQLDDGWYRNTIARGRPAKGMPTWGTVLSPAEINDVVALIAAWREGITVSPEVPLSSLITNALFALREFDIPDTVFYLNAAKAAAQGEQANELQAIITLIEENHLFDAQSLLIAFLPPAEMGKAVFDTNCAACHGADGTGGMGPNLHGNAFFQAKTDEELVQFILTGRRGTAMDGFEGILGEEEIRNVIILIGEWQK